MKAITRVVSSCRSFIPSINPVDRVENVKPIGECRTSPSGSKDFEFNTLPPSSRDILAIRFVRGHPVNSKSLDDVDVMAKILRNELRNVMPSLK